MIFFCFYSFTITTSGKQVYCIVTDISCICFKNSKTRGGQALSSRSWALHPQSNKHSMMYMYVVDIAPTGSFEESNFDALRRDDACSIELFRNFGGVFTRRFLECLLNHLARN